MNFREPNRVIEKYQPGQVLRLTIALPWLNKAPATTYWLAAGILPRGATVVLSGLLKVNNGTEVNVYFDNNTKVILDVSVDYFDQLFVKVPEPGKVWRSLV